MKFPIKTITTAICFGFGIAIPFSAPYTAIAQSQIEVGHNLTEDADATYEDIAMIRACADKRGDMLELQDAIKARRARDKRGIRVSFQGKLGSSSGRIVVTYDKDARRAASTFRPTGFSRSLDRSLTGSDREVYFDTTYLRKEHLESLAAIIEIIRTGSNDVRPGPLFEKAKQRVAHRLNILVSESDGLMATTPDTDELGGVTRAQQVANNVVRAARLSGTNFSFHVMNLPSVDAGLRNSAHLMKNSRIWTDVTGKHQVRAELVKSRGDVVVLRRKDTGKTITIPITTLSERDRDFLRKEALAKTH